MKSTNNKDRELSVKLSNLRRLATAPYPSFFVFMEFDGKADVQEIFILHVGDELVSRVVKRVYEEENKGNSDKLHKKKIKLKYREEEKLDEVTGVALRDRLLFFIGDNFHTYVQNKKDHLESTGYESGRYELNVEFSKDDLKKLVEMSVGLGGKLRAEKLKAVEKRFGILGSEPIIPEGGGDFSLENIKPTGVGKVTYKKSEFSPGISFDAELYTSPFNGFVPEKFQLVRISSTFFDLLIYPFAQKFQQHFYIRGDEACYASEARNIYSLLSMASKQDFLYCEYEFNGKKSQALKVRCDGVGYGYEKELEVAECLCEVEHRYGIADSEKTSCKEISSQADSISLLSKLVKGEDASFDVKFEAKKDEVDGKSECAFVFFVWIKIARRMIGVIAYFKNELVGENGNYEVNGAKIVVEDNFSIDINDSEQRKKLDFARKDIELRYEKDNKVFILEGSGESF
ncbi:hypothetical protein ACFO0E_10485 [Chromohalobacter beijerinckii]|uniref:Uncharacterized protein n=1 Tax=Chromohalobacter beijerinckii TaxID=86179 RepID=A0ABV8XFF5_9GAMM|nr:hypothetical protein [Chromohalobacter beijerinckii]MCK0765424.1 hypothetical protein [Chromohalobacter beijerinckii]